MSFSGYSLTTDVFPDVSSAGALAVQLDVSILWPVREDRSQGSESEAREVEERLEVREVEERLVAAIRPRFPIAE